MSLGRCSTNATKIRFLETKAVKRETKWPPKETNGHNRETYGTGQNFLSTCANAFGNISTPSERNPSSEA